MPEASLVEWIREKSVAIVQDLDERGRRRWSAAEAKSLGRGGIAAVAEATGISDRTIRNGMKELHDPEAAAANRQRRPGAGRPSREALQPDLIEAMEALVDAETRGEPMVSIRWICQSTRGLAKELRGQGFQVSSTKVGQLLRAQGYSLQANRKTVEGKQHPDRDAQFRHIAARVKAFQRTGQPVIAADTKKKESLGNMKNSGKRYRKKGSPRKVKTHDFPDPDAINDTECIRILKEVEAEIHRSPNSARSAMVMSVISIGICKIDLSEAAIAAGERIGDVEIDHGQTNCQTPAIVPSVQQALKRSSNKA